ncbi:MAG: F0F1 ATP synthase subunit delta [Solirubrobacterales bacterium]|nr:F0F1 ATP synthase subunit delta [Solirubrobacterales bacterium]MBV8943252.1 F0F1 ATP synthase subunit delta [Solirubrobacterales bacterium]MBV9168383.1 F0F1 ATP synthase subunit delta [Solirubrobacterales bacterium]MBV9534248.1 F0F1 ATP synthase subunit delta [Solirubrobacterales bacterium]
MEEIAQVYARALFEVAQERGLLDTIREQLDQFSKALGEDRQLQIFFFSPYFSSEEKKRALHRVVEGAEDTFMSFLETLIDGHRMPALFRIRARYKRLWDEANRVLPVSVTSAVPLDESIVNEIGERIGEQTGETVQLTTTADPEILGGIIVRVGNAILDASLRNRLNQLRNQLARA